MTGWLVAIATSLWLGILTSISPCPLATNIAAVSFVGRRVDRPMSVFMGGLLYTLGRVTAYTLLGVLLVYSLLSAPFLSHSLQKYMNIFLGPLLILVGIILLELFDFSFLSSSFGSSLQEKTKNSGIWSAALLGFVFALAFCPASAAIFFGSLIPLALSHESGFTLPAIYGVATGLPVLVFAVLLATGVNKAAAAFDRIKSFELRARQVTGVIFILVGIYFSLVNIFGIPLR